MKFRLATACAVICLGFVGSAFAEGRITATLESPQATPTKFIAAHTVWNCEGSTCVADASEDAGALDGCEAVASKVGRLTAFAGFKTMSEKTLAKCNTVAAPMKPIGTASR